MEKTAKICTTNADAESQQVLMKIVEYMAADICSPTSVQELCNALDITHKKAARALSSLAERDWVERVSAGWRLSPRIVKIADRVRKNINEAMKKYFEYV